MRDFRHRQGVKHILECSFAILAQLSVIFGALTAAAQFAAALTQEELARRSAAGAIRRTAV